MTGTSTNTPTTVESAAPDWKPKRAIAVATGVEAANAGPHPSFQGIEPIVPKEKRSFGCLRRRLYGIRLHGVISIDALTPIRFVETTRRLRHLQIRWNGSRLIRTPHAGVDASYSCVQTYSGHWDAILPRIGLDEHCGPVAPNRPT
jgi:hypothetical protein